MSEEHRPVEISDLESIAEDPLSGLEIPEELTNEYSVQEGDRTVSYRGTASGLHFENIDF